MHTFLSSLMSLMSAGEGISNHAALQRIGNIDNGWMMFWSGRHEALNLDALKIFELIMYV